MITLANLACGVIATMLAIKGVIHWAAIFIFLAAFFDLMDGLAARALNAKSAMGAQLDSLCDLVSFGVAPGLIMYTVMTGLAGTGTDWLSQIHELGTWPENYWSFSEFITMEMSNTPSMENVVYMSPWRAIFFQAAINIPCLISVLIFICAGAIRLAKFNTLPESKSFKGLAIPGAAILLASFALIIDTEIYAHQGRIKDLFSPWLYMSLIYFAAIFMLVNVRMFSFKLKSLSWADSKLQYIFLILCIPLVIVSIFLENFWLSIPLIVLLYIIVSLIDNILNKDEI